jgi:hypothetical protein
MSDKQELSVQVRFVIFEQLNKHQRAIDGGPGKNAVDNYISLYCPRQNSTSSTFAR